jgi:hypothetical protein
MTNSPDVEKAIQEAKKRIKEKRSQFTTNTQAATIKRKYLKN